MSTIELEILKANLRSVISPSLNELLLEITNNFVVRITINQDNKNERDFTVALLAQTNRPYKRQFERQITWDIYRLQRHYSDC